MADRSQQMLIKMHRRLTMQNLGIVALIFFILTSLTYSYVSYSLYQQKEERLQAFAHAMTEHDWTPRKRIMNTANRPNLGYLHIAPNGTLLRVDPTMPFEISDWREFVALATEQQGTMKYDGMTVYYAWDKSLYGMRVITFESDEVESAILDSIFWTFLIACLLSLIAFYLMSRYLAGKAVAPIAKAWETQKNFLADASHELRTPLTVIRTNLDVVMCSPEETVAEQTEWLDNIREETRAMSGLVESIFFMARADANQMKLERTQFDYRVMIELAVRAYKPMAEEKGITLTADLDNGAVICGDEDKLRRVLRVLVENAIRHTPAGGTITVRMTHDAKMTELAVIDTGEGIPLIHQEHLFERFYQADRSRSKGGAGLGLAIAKWIVEEHGGTISLKSAVGEGAAFTVRLPKGETHA